MADIVEISTGTIIKNVSQRKAIIMCQTGRYYIVGQKVEVSVDLATEILEKEKESLIAEREMFEKEKAEFSKEKAEFEATKLSNQPVKKITNNKK